jgi:hypothetical protein
MKESSERHNKTREEKSSAGTISSEESMVIDVNLTSHEDLKSSNFECFLYMSVNYKRKHQWMGSTKREERKSMQEVPY